MVKETLQKMVRHLEDDLRQRLAEVPELHAHVEQQHHEARASGRTGESFTAFADQQITQAAVSWVLSAVFVRFLEDNGLLDSTRHGKQRWIAGDTLETLDLAQDQEREYFRTEPSHGEREYLLYVFRRIGKLPGLDRLFDEAHTPLWHLTPSADGTRDLIELFRQRHAESGEVLLTFTRPGLETRFLGDLYQDLSEATRKRYALLQTPDFVESFLLDRSLTPALAAWGHQTVRLIDPACGSGHFLLGAFERLLAEHLRASPAENPRVLVQRTLDQVAGVDLNPYAAAIARFRLLIAALAACGITRLAGAPDFHLRVANGDSLLHGQRPATRGQTGELFSGADLASADAEHYFASEDPELLRNIFAERYHVVVANPPYITVKDPGLRDEIRRRFPESCHGKYSLVCPFMERLFDLAITDGHIAAIVGNAFIKRQFGKKFVETVLPDWDLTHIIDTSGAFIPGHGTPTVMLIARARGPVATTVRTVMGIRGEPSTPEVPAEGKVWSAIVEQVDRPGSESEWVSVEDVERKTIGEHPWSLQGGGASELKATIEEGKGNLATLASSIGITAFTLEDELFLLPRHAAHRHEIGSEFLRPMVLGDRIRDWGISESVVAVFPYDNEFQPLKADHQDPHFRYLWKARTSVANNKLFGGKTKVEGGLKWFEYGRLTRDKLRIPLSIAFAFVATHNHFVLDRGGKVFKQSAPVIKLPPDATVDDHLELVGLLNSSTACFWMKQVFFDKGVGGIGGGIGDEGWEPRYEHDGTKLKQFPLPKGRPFELARRLDELAQRRLATTPAAVCAEQPPTRERLDQAREEHESIGRQMIALQEELDWRCYNLYGLLANDLTTGSEEPPPLELGERAFEIALARRVAAGEASTTWFERHGSTPITELPGHWPAEYRELVERRLQALAEIRAIAMLERPEFKRRWSHEAWEKLESEALRSWLLDRLEAPELWPEPRLTTTARLADHLRGDADFRRVAALYRGVDDPRLTRLITELVSAEGVPYLARQRYKPSGLRKRAVWESVWKLQRREDALDARTELPQEHPEHLSASEATRLKEELAIPVPPKYARGDFAQAGTWSHRGKLDVPKERFVLYPGAERTADPSPVVGWAGWNHLERARALAAAYVEGRDQEAWPRPRLEALLDGLDELLPWLLQWHDEIDPAFGIGLGTYFRSFVDEERRRLAERSDAS